MAAPEKTILDEAKGLIYGDREEQYGDAFESFGNIAAGWSTIFGVEVTPEKVCLAMAWLKTCRLLNQPDHHDSVVDSAGYAGCYEKVLAARSKREQSAFEAKAQAGGVRHAFKQSDPKMVAAMATINPVDPRMERRHQGEI